MRMVSWVGVILILCMSAEAAQAAEPSAAGAGSAAAGPADDTAADADTAAVAADWPRVFTIDGRTVTLYQPQPEKLTGNILKERAAVSVQNGDADPVFGALWLTASLDIDREQRVASVDTLTLDRMRFPEGEAGDQAAATLQAYVAKAVTPKNIVVDLDSLITTLDQTPGAANLYQVAPPTIYIRTAPTELLTPVVEAAGGTGKGEGQEQAEQAEDRAFDGAEARGALVAGAPGRPAAERLHGQQRQKEQDRQRGHDDDEMHGHLLLRGLESRGGLSQDSEAITARLGPGTPKAHCSSRSRPTA